MEQLPIVKKRVRIWPILLTLVVIALLVAAVFYLMGDRAITDVTMLWPGMQRAAVATAVWAAARVLV